MYLNGVLQATINFTIAILVIAEVLSQQTLR
jgi:hypothetical protein